MGFFNSSTADVVQHISIAVEAIGLTLTYIEVRHPEKADRIEDVIDQLAARQYPKSGPLRALQPALYCLITIALAWAPLSFIGSLRVQGYISGGAHLAITLAVIAVGIALFFWGRLADAAVEWISSQLSTLISALNKWSGGRALGTLGVLFALLGFIGEIYQIFTLYLE